MCDELDCSPYIPNPDQDCTNIDENQFNKQLINVYDVLGRSINQNTKNILLFEKYNDGSVEKKYIK